VRLQLRTILPISGILGLLVLTAGGLTGTAQTIDYITDEEVDLIRDAQGLQTRVPALLKLADNRIVALGLREISDKEREQIRRDIERYEAEVREAAKVKDAEVRAKPVNPAVYLRNFSRTQLLRGYMQVIDEVMDNIDDAFDRRLEVRASVEDLEQFVRDQLPRLQKFEAKTSGETAALEAVLRHSELVLDDIREALAELPKTERRSTSPERR
jgi:hypothetical protein